jgi:hypothetical protein
LALGLSEREEPADRFAARSPDFEDLADFWEEGWEEFED